MTPDVRASVSRSLVVSLLALAVMGALAYQLPGSTKAEALASLVALSAAGTLIYVGAMAKLRAPELIRLRALVGRSGGA